MALNVTAQVESILDRLDCLMHRLLDGLHRAFHGLLDRLDRLLDLLGHVLDGAGGGVQSGLDVLLQGIFEFFDLVSERDARFRHLLLDHIRFLIHCTFSLRASAVSLGSGLKESSFFLPLKNRAAPTPVNTPPTMAKQTHRGRPDSRLAGLKAHQSRKTSISVRCRPPTTAKPMPTPRAAAASLVFLKSSRTSTLK